MPPVRPPLVVRRFFNPIAMRLGISGTRVLTVTGRRSGLRRSVPVLPVVVAGHTYLVSPRGRTDWARNLRAAGTCLLGPHGHQRPHTAVEIPPDERAQIIAAYRIMAGRAVRSFFERSPDPRDHPVFRVDPA